MIITAPNLTLVTKGFKTAFQGMEELAPQDHLDFTTVVTSDGSEEEYGWLGQVAGMRKWLGDREIKNLREYGYKLVNDDYEDTFSVPRNRIADDKYGMYSMKAKMMGEAAFSHPCEISYAQWLLGFTIPCYDGQNFFDAAHPVLDANGSEVQVANTDGGAGTPWFLIYTRGLIKPIVLQVRQKPVFTSLDQLTDANVFNKKEFIYGADDRKAPGFGMWRHAWGSRQPLNYVNYWAARSAMGQFKGDYGRPMGIVPDTLLVPPSLEEPARALIDNERLANGASNTARGTAKVKVAAWLA